MTIPNYPTGYEGFHEAIETVTAALGGDPMRKAVSAIFVESLYREIHAGMPKGSYFPWGVAWTKAKPADFDRATAWTMEYLQRQRENRSAEAAFGICTIGIRGSEAVLEGGGYGFPIASFFNNIGGAWMISISDVGEHVLSEGGWHLHSGKPKTAHARSEAAAAKSLLRLVQTHFKVELGEPAAVPSP